MADDNATEVFIYTGLEQEVPDDVVRVQVDPSVMAIPEISFASNYLLEVVELHDDLREIGPHAFSGCTALNDVRISDRVESIGPGAFSLCAFTTFRVRHSLSQSLMVCSANVETCFLWSCQKKSFALKVMHASIATRCAMLPLHPTLWLRRMLSWTA